jgi:hypothetical protein
MTEEEIEDENFRKYLEARWLEGIFEELDARILMGENDGRD